MLVSGVVIHVEPGGSVLDALSGHEWLTLAAAEEPTRVPAVLEARTAAEGRDRARSVEETNGVVRVDVVFVGVDPETEAQHAAELGSP